MLSLKVDDGQTKSFFYDQIVNVEVIFESKDTAQVTLQVNMHGQSAQDTEVVIPIYEKELDMKTESVSHTVHLHCSNQSLSEISVEFVAVAVVPKAAPRVKKTIKSMQTASPFDFSFPVIDLVESVPQEHEDPAQLGHEVARDQLIAELVPCVDMSIHYIRPGYEKDKVLCQYDFAAFEKPLEVSALDFSIQQGKSVPLVPLKLPLVIPEKGCWSFALQSETLLPSLNCKSSVSMEYTCDGKHIKSQWVSKINLTEALGPVTKTPTLPLSSKRNSAVSMRSAQSVSSQTALYPAPSNNASASYRTSLSGVSIHLHGPKKVRLGEEFEWNLTFVNKSNRVRKLALIFNTKETGLPQILAKQDERALVSDSFTLKKRIDCYRAGTRGPTGIIPLVPSVRVGQIGAYACFTAPIRLLAAELGLHSVSGSAVHDYTFGEVYETGELLKVLVEA